MVWIDILEYFPFRHEFESQCERFFEQGELPFIFDVMRILWDQFFNLQVPGKLFKMHKAESWNSGGRSNSHIFNFK